MSRTKTRKFSTLKKYLDFLSKTEFPKVPSVFCDAKALTVDRKLAVKYDLWLKKNLSRFPRVYAKNNIQNALEIPDLNVVLQAGESFEISAIFPKKVLSSQSLKRAIEKKYLVISGRPELKKQLQVENFGFPIYSFNDDIDLENATYLETCSKAFEPNSNVFKKSPNRGGYKPKKIVTVSEKVLSGCDADDSLEISFLDTSTGKARPMREFSEPGEETLAEDQPSEVIVSSLPSVKYKRTKNKDGEGGSLTVDIE